jgi:carboxylate-amine ligase
VPAVEAVQALAAHLRPALEEHGDWEEVTALVELTLARGNGAARQRAAYARSGDLGQVVDLLVTETAGGS